MDALALRAHRRQAEYLHAGKRRLYRLHGRDELTLAGLVDQDRRLGPLLGVEAVAILRIQHPLDHRPRHLREAGHEVMVAQRESGNAIHRIRNDGGALRELAHRQALRRRLLQGKAVADLALGLRVQLQPDTEGGGRALARVVIRRGADAAEAEDDIARSESALQGGGQPPRIVTEVVGPCEPQAALLEGADQEAEVLVFALADEQLVADDQRAEHQAAFWAQRSSSSSPPMCRALTNTCGTVPRPVIAPTTRERSLWLSVTSLYW